MGTIMLNLFKKKTQKIIVFVKKRGKWELRQIKTYLNDTVDIENFLKQKRFEDFKVWMIDNIDTDRYWNDINFYNIANFIYLPLESPFDKKWAWFNMDEPVPYPTYYKLRIKDFKMDIIQKDDDNLKDYVIFNFSNFSNDGYPILKIFDEINQVELIKKFLQDLKQNKHATCTVSGLDPYTFLAWGKNGTIRFQLWHYEPEILFECKNGMDLIIDLEVEAESFYSEFTKSIQSIIERNK